jgi:Uma2 family endonuclease
MVRILEKPLDRLVLSNVRWNTFEHLLEDIGESHYRITYDNGELEFMTLSFEHENAGIWIGRLIFFVALEWHMPICSGGSTTLKQSLRQKGLEPDECFWIKNERAMRGKKRWDALTDPPPDLGIEIDITRSSLDRQGIYAALKVPEIWRYDGEILKVLALGANEKYRERSKSLAFPNLPIEGFTRFVKQLGDSDETTLVREFVDWLRQEVPSKRKNGKTRP